MFKLFWIDACNIQNVVREMSIPVASGRVSGSNWCRLNPPNILRQAFLCGKLGRWFPRDSTLNWKLLSIKIMKQSHAVQKSEFNFESTGYDNCVSQAGFWVTFSVLVALWLRHLTLMTPTSCPVDISLSSNKYSIILTYCFTVTECKYIPYKWHTILPDSRKTVVYDKINIILLSLTTPWECGRSLGGVAGSKPA